MGLVKYESVWGSVWLACHISIYCYVGSVDGGFMSYISFIYGSNYDLLRGKLWKGMIGLKNKVQDGAWFTSGDFNSIQEEGERFDGESNGYEIDLDSWLHQSDLVDHPYTSCFYAGSNKREANEYIAKSWME